MYKKSRFSHKRSGEGHSHPGKGFSRPGRGHDHSDRGGERSGGGEGGGGWRSDKGSGYSGGHDKPAGGHDGAAPFRPRKNSGAGKYGPPKKVFRNKFPRRDARKHELPEIVRQPYATPRPEPPEGYYPLDPAGPLCPLLRRPDLLWQTLYADRARHRELLSLARRFHAVPEAADTSLEQDRTLALRMFDSPAGRRWIEENQKIEVLVSLDNAIYRRFLDARRQGQDPLQDLAQMLRSTERKEPNTRRTVFSLPEWEQIVAQVPDWGRRTAQNAALWACVFAIREPEKARKILDPLIETGGTMFARWFGLIPPEEETEAGAEDEAGNVTSRKADEMPAREVDEPSDGKTEAFPEPHNEDKPASGDINKHLSGANTVGSSPEPHSVPKTSRVGLASVVPVSSAANSWKTLDEHWEAARVHFESLLRAPTFQGMEALLVCLADLLEQREHLLENSMDYLERSLMAMAPGDDDEESDEDDPDASLMSGLALDSGELPLDVDECADGGDAAPTPQALREWVRGLEETTKALQAKLLVAPGEVVEKTLRPFLALAQPEDSSQAAFNSPSPEVRARYATIHQRLLNSPERPSVARSEEKLRDAWEELGRKVVDFEQAVAALAQAIPAQPAEQDENMRAFLECLEGLRCWIERNWLGDAGCLDMARQLLDLLALPKFSWQPTRRRIQELGFLAASPSADSSRPS